jgi:NAD(P)-dependent dehydrogenase (short-subunit alcohol dehydrogenase family)
MGSPYSYTGPVDHTIASDLTQVHGKSVIVTGGANGLGESIVREFVNAGAFVTFADLDDERGRRMEAEINNRSSRACVFVKCDVRAWEDQKVVFETARAESPSGSVDVVIANAGISRSSGDSLWDLDGIVPVFILSSSDPYYSKVSSRGRGYDTD